MANYIGEKCSLCKKEFKSGDDIVVCPDCGAPYHRNCYKESGRCVYECEHESGFTWKAEQKEVNENDKLSKKKCPICFNENDMGALFCNRCGHHFISKPSPNSSENKVKMPNGMPFPNEIPFIINQLNQIDPNEDINGVKSKALAKYIKVSVPYYMHEFRKRRDKRSNRFNFAAFLFSGGWLLYRRQYKWGIIIILILALLSIGSTFLQLTYNKETLNQILSIANVSFTGAGPVVNYEVSQRIASAFITLPITKQVLMFLPTVSYFIQFVIMLVLGINGNRMYYNHCIKKVKKIKEEGLSEEKYYNKLSDKGGVNTPLGICLLLCYAIIIYLPMFIF
jgi:hypothetical protein